MLREWLERLRRRDRPRASPWVERTQELLRAAGRALDPEGPDSVPDLRLASALLSHATCAAAAALTTEPAEDAESAVAGLSDSILKKTAGSRVRAQEHALAVSPGTPPRADELRGVELFVARLSEEATHGGALRRATLRSTLVTATGLALLLAALVGPPLASWAARDGLPFQASSAIPGYSATGKTGEPQGDTSLDLFFHTKTEDHPWIEINLGRLRRIHRVIVQNRFDCCSDRDVPLVLQLRDAQGNYHEVARRTEDFSRLTLDFPPQEATAVKLLVPRVTAFHLANVQIR